MSPRTLRRRLVAMGVKYQQLVDEVRRIRACKLLSDTDSSVAEIAQQLGFGTTSSFQRAFMRWMGCSASHYRATVLHGGSQ
jgi:AraC-like DNA-binding protein